MVELLPRLKGIVLRRDFGVLTVSVQAKKGLVTKKDRQAFSSALKSQKKLTYARLSKHPRQSKFWDTRILVLTDP